jgi:hypothetical protein
VGRLPGDLPLALSDNQKIYGSRGFDLIYGNVTRVRLLPFMESKIVYLSCASFSQQKVIGTMGKYQCFNDFAGSLQEDRDSDEYREEVDWAVVPKLLSLLFYRRPTNPSNIFSKNEEILGLPELKNRIGADSDNPILTSRVDSKTSKTAFRQLALYAQSLARKGFGLNFVVITVDEDGYFQSNFDFVEKLLLEDDTKEKPSEIFHNLIIIKESERSPKEIESLKILSTLYIDLGAGSFKDQVESEYKRL